MLTRDFIVVTAATMSFMVGFGATLPVLPRYVSGPLDGSDLAVGIVVGSYAISAILLRPFIGRMGDLHGRRLLIMVGASVTGIGMLAHIPADSISLLIGARLIVGAGQGAIFVGAATLINDLAPPDRRGQAASYFSVAIYTGLGFGPFIGETLLARGSYDLVWGVVTAAMAGAVAIASFLPKGLPLTYDDDEPIVERTGISKVLHPDGLGPGIILFLGVVGFIGFNTFVPLYGEEIGLDDVAAVFLLFSGVVLLVRLVGSRLPDTFGPIVVGTVALAAGATGLLGIAIWQSPVGLYVFTVVLAVGSSLLYPALMTAAVNAAPERERSSAVATFTMFFEIASALGGAVLGIVASLSSYSGAFVAAACFSLTALVMLHVYLRPRLAVRSAHV